MDSGKTPKQPKPSETIEKPDIDTVISAPDGKASISDEDAFKSVEEILRKEKSDDDKSELNEDIKFFEFIKYFERAQKLGIGKATTSYHGGVHIVNSNVSNSGSITGNDQLNNQYDEGGNIDEIFTDTVESIFDKDENLESRSFMVALAALNGCSYHVVLEASHYLQSIIEPSVEKSV
jgi:hypothetical protein